MSSQFDANAFMQTTFEEAPSTDYVLVPVGEYPAIIKKVSAERTYRDNDSGNESPILEVTWEVNDPDVAEATGSPVNTVRQGIFLRLNSNGGLDDKTNQSLGHLLKATNYGQNGSPWTFEGLNGKAATVAVTHEPDKNDASKIYARVNRVTGL